MKTDNHIDQDVIPLSSPLKWKKALEGINHAFGHTWESCYAMHLTTGSPTYLYTLKRGESRAVCPFAERSFNGYTDIYTPYGISGFAGEGDFPELQEYWNAFAAGRGYVCGYIGLNPIFENPTYLNEKDISCDNSLFILDLSLSLEHLYRNMQSGKRDEVRKAERNRYGYTTDKHLLKPFFLKNYAAYMKRKNATMAYSFTIKTLSYLINLDMTSMVGIINNGKIEAATLNAYTPYIAEGYLFVSVPHCKNHTMALLWNGVKQLKAKNIPLFNLGGGIRENDSIAQYKRRLGGMEKKLKSLKQIYDPRLYDQLCNEACAPATDTSGYFPPYRKPQLRRSTYAEA